MKPFLANFYGHLGIFIWSHWPIKEAGAVYNQEEKNGEGEVWKLKVSILSKSRSHRKILFIPRIYLQQVCVCVYV